jgi:ubiquinone/menaquinone biosynthesis C-methylase UbiE
MTAFEDERNRLRERVWSFLDIKQGARYLDIGIGHTAHSLHKLLELGLDVTSVDIDLDVLRKHKTRKAHFVQGDAAALPFKRNTFSLSVANFTFHEIEPSLHNAVCSELCRVSKKIMVIEPSISNEPIHRRYQNIWTKAMHSVGQFEDYQNMDYWTELLRKSGAKIANVEKLASSIRLRGQEARNYMKSVVEDMREEGVSEKYLKEISGLSHVIETRGMIFSDIDVVIGHVSD